MEEKELNSALYELHGRVNKLLKKYKWSSGCSVKGKTSYNIPTPYTMCLRYGMILPNNYKGVW